MLPKASEVNQALKLPEVNVFAKFSNLFLAWKQDWRSPKTNVAESCITNVAESCIYVIITQNARFVSSRETKQSEEEEEEEKN